MTKISKIQRLLWGLNSEPTDFQSGIITITLKSQLWVGDTEKLSVAFSHASLILVESTNSFNLTNPIQNQWRIQDIPGRRAPTPKVGVLTYYCANFFRKTSEKIDRIWTDGVPVAPLGSANEIGKTRKGRRTWMNLIYPLGLNEEGSTY